jgi:hypothetical protein
MSEGFWWNWWVQFGVAVSTLTAAIVALFGEAFRRKFFLPKLELALLGSEGEKTEVVSTEGTTRKSAAVRYYHLQVSNSRRWSPATDVQVHLLQVEERGPSAKLQIAWSVAVPLIWRHQDVFPTSRTIGAPGDVDVCSVREDRVLQLQVLVHPFNLITQFKEPIDRVLTLRARGNEVDSAPLRLRISWDGKWDDGTHEIGKHFVIEPI